jgi:6-phosphogluconolactonase
MQPEIRRFSDLEELSRSAAGFVRESAESAVEEKNLFSLVLSGGGTPRRLYELLAKLQMPWDRTHLFWGDERCVPPDHPDSNYHLAYSAFISRVPVPSDRVHRIPADGGPASADEYEQTLQRFFENQHPFFDLILLGLGADGHIASLFPDHPAVDETTRLVANVSGISVPRVTLTLPALNRARCIAFLVSGDSKREITERILSKQKGTSESSPAARVKPKEKLVWFLAGMGQSIDRVGTIWHSSQLKNDATR